MFKELLEALNKADTTDFVNCLKENLLNSNEKYYNMLMGIKMNDPVHYNSLSKGCQAAMIIYFNLYEMSLLDNVR